MVIVSGRGEGEQGEVLVKGHKVSFMQNEQVLEENKGHLEKSSLCV